MTEVNSFDFEILNIFTKYVFLENNIKIFT